LRAADSQGQVRTEENNRKKQQKKTKTQRKETKIQTRDTEEIQKRYRRDTEN
jgi:hypothetical protein